MKKAYVAKAALFLVLSVGLLLGLCIAGDTGRRAENYWSFVGDDAFMKEAAGVISQRYYGQYGQRAWWAEYHRKPDIFGTYREDHGPAVAYELWQTQDALGYYYTRLAGFDTAQYPFSERAEWNRWKLEEGVWTDLGHCVPAPWAELEQVGGFSMELPRVEITPGSLDEKVQAEMIPLLEQLVTEEYPRSACDMSMIVCANTDRMVAMLMLPGKYDGETLLRAGEGITEHDHVLRVQFERGERLSIAEYRPYGHAEDNHREAAFYQDILECGGCFLVYPGFEEGRERIRAALLENGPFIDAVTGETVTLEQVGIMISPDPVEVRVGRFALLQMDPVMSMGSFINRYQGLPEAVVELEVNGVESCSLILRWDEDGLQGYVLPYRGFNNIKADGSGSFSSGAYDSGYGYLAFHYDEAEAGVGKMAWSESSYSDSGELTVRYQMGGLEWDLTEEEFQNTMAWQAEKPDAVWQDITPENVDAALADAS